MKDDNLELHEAITRAINDVTATVSDVLLQEFLKLPQELQMNIVLIKSSQLLLANILCHVARTKDELEHISMVQGDEVKELTFNCASTAFSGKFDIKKH